MSFVKMKIGVVHGFFNRLDAQNTGSRTDRRGLCPGFGGNSGFPVSAWTIGIAILMCAAAEGVVIRNFNLQPFMQEKYLHLLDHDMCTIFSFVEISNY